VNPTVRLFCDAAVAHAHALRRHGPPAQAAAILLREPRDVRGDGQRPCPFDLQPQACHHLDGRYVRRLGQLARIGLLVLDDFLLTSPSVIEAKDLLEVIDDRSQVRSTLVVSQLPVEAWHPALAGGDPTLADAILDRLVQHAHRLPLTGASMRRRQPPPETDNPVA